MEEMNKLHEMLLNANISHTFKKMNELYLGENALQIRIYRDTAFQDELDDVVFNQYSYGYELGLLETYNLGGCVGFESAEEVFNGWMEKFFS